MLDKLDLSPLEKKKNRLPDKPVVNMRCAMGLSDTCDSLSPTNTYIPTTNPTTVVKNFNYQVYFYEDLKCF